MLRSAVPVIYQEDNDIDSTSRMPVTCTSVGIELYEYKSLAQWS